MRATSEMRPMTESDDSEYSSTPVGLNLFWRTFFLIAALLVGSMLAWIQTLNILEFEAHAVETAEKLASQVNLSRAALLYSDSIARVALLKTISDQEGLRIVPREPHDRFTVVDDDALRKRVAAELAKRLGKGTVVANSVNNQPGFWIGFVIDGDDYWLLTDQERVHPVDGRTWGVWAAVATALSLVGAALIAV